MVHPEGSPPLASSATCQVRLCKIEYGGHEENIFVTLPVEGWHKMMVNINFTRNANHSVR